MDVLTPEFVAFRKIPRLYREAVISEKLDGSNAIVHIADDGTVTAGSRNRWLSAEHDNHGFYAWVQDNKDDLLSLGPGYHYGEWWGRKILRGYGLKEKRFSLFNTTRWTDDVRPSCCHVVPVLWQGPFDIDAVRWTLIQLRDGGSRAAPGYMNPEGIVLFHEASNHLYKVTIEGDGKPKSIWKKEAQACTQKILELEN